MKTVLGVNNLSVIVDAHLKSDHVYNLHLFWKSENARRKEQVFLLEGV